MSTTKEKWKNLHDKLFQRNLKARKDYNNSRNIYSNCSNTDTDHIRRLKLFEEEGNHVQDEVFQKLYSAYRKEGSAYFRNYTEYSLARLGNRTMTQEEYWMIQKTPEKNLVDFRLTPELKELHKKLGYSTYRIRFKAK